LVRWFAMRARQSSDFASNDEVDGIRWVEVPRARELLSHEFDVAVLDRIDPVMVLTSGVFFLVRHAAAGSRSDWDGEDRERPLSNRGQRQAQGLVDLLGGREIERILSSPFVRCRQTVEPLATVLGLEIEVREELAEATGYKPTRDLIREMVGTNALVCSHGDVIPALLDWMIRRGMSLKSSFECKKGSTWEVEVRAGEFRKARYLPSPIA
jgi:8-oxo-dGTP diphosphatase